MLEDEKVLKCRKYANDFNTKKAKNIIQMNVSCCHEQLSPGNKVRVARIFTVSKIIWQKYGKSPQFYSILCSS